MGEKKRFYFRTLDSFDGYGKEIIMRVIASDFGDAMSFITQMVVKENGKGNPMKLSDWVFLREELEDRPWMDFTGFDITY